MKNFKFLLLSSLLITACADKSSDSYLNPTDSSSGIIGGTEVKAGSREIRSTVGLYDKMSKSLCTGTLVSGNLVLTAAHCIGSDPKQMIVLFKDQFEGAKKEDMRPVVNAKTHDYYNPKAGTNMADIALVKFDPEAGLPGNYAPAQLLPDFNLLQSGASVVAVGYGLNRSWVVKSGAGTLRTVELEVRDPHFSETETSVNQSLKRGVCSGDSGGPGYMDINGQLYVWGVVSRGDSLPIPLTPNCFIFSVYTRIDVYMPWLKKTAAELNAQ